MTHKLDQVAISVRSHRLLTLLLNENPVLKEILTKARNETDAVTGVRNWVLDELKKNPDAYAYYKRVSQGRKAFEKLSWKDYAAIRIIDYTDNAGRVFEDLNLGGEEIINNPIRQVWLAARYGKGGANPNFFEDMLQLFRQFSGEFKMKRPQRDKVMDWMARWPSGLDPRIVKVREANKERIIRILIHKIDEGLIWSRRFNFEKGMTYEQKFSKCLEWWEDKNFHLKFAVRSPKLLNEFLGNSLDPETMKVLLEAEKKGIPFFVNPYYLSLLNVQVPDFAVGADLAIRAYVVYSQQLIDEYGHIVAWEKEDEVEPGKPNAAGWLLPNDHNIHRRYPEVAIFIPDTAGRACGGLCASCQRMYDFQSGHLNFNIEKLKPGETWNDKLIRLMHYFEEDSQLRDILITGGDALMSSDKSLAKILDQVYEMAIRKIESNKSRPNGEKYAEMVRVRLGTRLPVYLPQRITTELARILGEFKEKALKAGVKQFIIQTHFESPMEVTPDSRRALQLLISSGWTVTNQLVFTAAASRRGHSARLREVLNDLGVLNYYTFTVKGYMENNFSFATNARAVQEQIEEKVVGLIPDKYYHDIRHFPEEAEKMVENINRIRSEADIPFLATDRNVLNLPGVGKSLTYRTIGITRHGRRILEFDYDSTRNHTPALHSMDRVIIVESKPIGEYLRQLDEMGEDRSEYKTIWGYSIGETEPRNPVYEYPDYDFAISSEYTNLGE